MNKREVFLIQHARPLGNGEEDIKTIGVYSSREAAQFAIERLRLRPGFRDFSEGFTIDLYWLDQDSWQEGFVTLGTSREDEEGNSGGSGRSD